MHLASVCPVPCLLHAVPCPLYPVPCIAMASKERIFLGLCVGRETDGVDCALAGVAGRGPRMKVRQISHHHAAMPAGLADRLAAIDAHIAEAGSDAALAWLTAEPELTHALVQTVGAAIAHAKVPRDRIAAVGLLGHVVVHSGEPTAGLAVHEIGNVSHLARNLGLSVVADIARAAIAPDGTRTALAWPDWLMLHDRRLSRVVVHLGAVTSVTFVPADSIATDTVSFDAAPGTTLLKDLAVRLTGAADPDGTLAAKAQPHAALLNELLASPFFRAQPPKTASSAQWGTAYADRLLLMARRQRCDQPETVLATAVELVARATATAVGNLTQRPHEVILAGPGAYNIHLGTRIRSLLSPSSTYPSQKYGLDAQAWQAMGMAVLAAARLDESPLPTPEPLGQWRQSVIGGLYLP